MDGAPRVLVVVVVVVVARREGPRYRGSLLRRQLRRVLSGRTQSGASFQGLFTEEERRPAAVDIGLCGPSLVPLHSLDGRREGRVPMPADR